VGGNFREDVTVNGLINSSDISFVQSKRHGLALSRESLLDHTIGSKDLEAIGRPADRSISEWHYEANARAYPGQKNRDQMNTARAGLNQSTASTMKKNFSSNAGIFSPRMLLAFSLCFAGVFLATFGIASADPETRPRSENRRQRCQRRRDIWRSRPNGPEQSALSEFLPARWLVGGIGQRRIQYRVQSIFPPHLRDESRTPIVAANSAGVPDAGQAPVLRSVVEDKSAASLNTGLDPILWTDQKTRKDICLQFDGRSERRLRLH